MEEAKKIIKELEKLIENSDDKFVIGLLTEARDCIDIVADDIK